MTRLIDADALRKVIHCEFSDDLGILDKIDNAPTIDAYQFEQVQELVKLNQQFAQEIENLKRPKGKWLETGHINLRQCSNCGSQWGIYSIEDFDFCPSCGADMREVGSEEDTNLI